MIDPETLCRIPGSTPDHREDNAARTFFFCTAGAMAFVWCAVGVIWLIERL